MCWKAEYLVLIIFTTVVDYFAALKMGQATSRKKKKPWLILSLLANVGMLAGFKYFNFFTDSVNLLFQGIQYPSPAAVVSYHSPGRDFILYFPVAELYD